MKDEDCFQATMLDFQEVRILHSHSDNHTHTLYTITTMSIESVYYMHTLFVKCISQLTSLVPNSV